MQKRETTFPAGNPVELQVSRRLVRLRTEMGLTQRALASRCHLSAAYLSRVERNETSLTIASLAKVAEVLGVSVAAMFDDEPSTAPLSFHRVGTGAMRLLRGKGSHAYRVLAAGKRGKLMEPILVEVSDRESSAKLSSHAGDEFNYLLEGHCTFFYGETRFAMRAGDAVYYDATVLHGIRSDKGVRSRLLSIVTSRDYLFHGDISRLLEPVDSRPSGKKPQVTKRRNAIDMSSDR